MYRVSQVARRGGHFLFVAIAAPSFPVSVVPPRRGHPPPVWTTRMKGHLALVWRR